MGKSIRTSDFKKSFDVEHDCLDEMKKKRYSKFSFLS